MAELIQVYGAYVALAIVSIAWLANKLIPVALSERQADIDARNKKDASDREQRLKREDEDRAEHREDRDRLIRVVESNTAALTKVATLVDVISRDVGVIYAHLNLSRPTTRSADRHDRATDK